MAYISDYTYASDDEDVDSHTGVLPNYEENDLLVWLAHKDSSTGSHLTVPDGWTSIYASSLKNEMLACYKFASSSETAPTTSSSDSDAYQSAMFCIKGADTDTPISDIDTISNGDTITCTTYTYFKPSDTAVGNLHFVFASASGVGGVSIENYGRRYINDESISVAMNIQVNTITDVNDVPGELQVSQHTATGMLQFEVIDDGNNLSEPVCYNDLDIIELATDGMVNGSTLGNSDLTTLNGLDVVNGTITDNGGDIGFYPLQKAPYLKGSKGLQYTLMELVLENSIDLTTDMLAVSVYPYKPKYQPTIGIGTQGRLIYLMDGNGNYKAFNIDSADNKLLNFAMQFTYIIDTTAPAFASSGTVDLSAITKIGFGERSRTIVCYMAFNRLYRYRDSTIMGGTSTLRASFSTLLNYQDGSYFRPNLLQGQEILVQVPIEIGNGNTDTYFYDENKIVEYPANYDVAEREYLFHQTPNRSGINFNITANSEVGLSNMILQGSSDWYFTSSNTNGVININDSTLKGCGLLILTSNMHFKNSIFIFNSEITGDIDIIDSTLSSPKGSYIINLGNVINFKNIVIKEFEGKYALHIPASVTGTITLDNILVDGSGTDIYWEGTSGTLTVKCINGTNISTSDSAGGTVDIQNGKNFKFAVTPSITGYEWRIYEVDNIGSLAGASELAGEESATADNQTYSYNYTADTPIAVQIIGHDNDYVESVTYYTLGSSDQNVTITLTKDINN